MYRVDLIPPDYKAETKIHKTKKNSFRVKKSQSVGDSEKHKKGNKQALLQKQQLLDFKEILEESIDLFDRDSYTPSESTSNVPLENIHGDTYERRRRDEDYIDYLKPAYGPKK